MIYKCESCGKKYRIDVSKLTSDEVTFQCRACNAQNTIRKPGAETASPQTAEQPQVTEKEQSAAPSASVDLSAMETDGDSWKKNIRLGLRGKMILLFCIVPVLAMAAGTYYYLNRMQTLSSLITEESTEIVTKMAEMAIAEKARSAAAEMNRYIAEHPEVPKEEYNTHPVFRAIGIQKVGKTGYTCMVSKEMENGVLWIHPLQKLVGVDITNAMKKALGNEYQRWHNLQAKAFKTGKSSQGYYMWYDKREKYLVMQPVEGTDYFIASTTYLDEFTTPVKALQERTDALTGTTARIVLLTLSALILFVAAVAVFYGNRLSGSIRQLTEVADRMSLGELNEEINIKSKDEIGVLAEAIKRMQNSIRISIERLRRRR